MNENISKKVRTGFKENKVHALSTNENNVEVIDLDDALCGVKDDFATNGKCLKNQTSATTVTVGSGEKNLSGKSELIGSVSDFTTNNGDFKKPSKKNQPTISYVQIFRYATSFDYVLLIIGTLAAAAHGAALPVLLIFFGELTNDFVNFGSLDTASLAQVNLSDKISTNSVRFCVIAIIVWICGAIQIICWTFQAVRQTKKIRVLFFQSILRQDIGFFDVNSAGELNTRMADDIGKIQSGIGDKVSITIMNVVRTMTSFIISMVYSWKLALVVLAVSPALAISAAILYTIGGKFTKEELDSYAKAGAVAEEVISSIRTVVAFGGQEKECERYEENLLHARKVGLKKGLVSGASLGFLFLCLFAMYGLGFWYGSTLVLAGEIVVGDLLTSFFSVVVGAFTLGQAGSHISEFGAGKVAAYKVFEIIDRVPPIDSESEDGYRPENVNGEVSLNNVNFSYPSRTDLQVLNNVSFKLETGKTTALCGQSGCGKSTCVQLIQRFYDPESGAIEVDGIDIRTLNLRWLREHIGVVSQEPILFDTTIAENIKYGRDGVTDEEIEEATKQSNAYDFIMKLPDKFETMVGEGGAQMSGGQKQRIAIARAIVRDPKILLLDEATSALDTESEGVVQAALDRAAKGRTTLVIAHRLSTIRNADKIIGFHEGIAVEQGTHRELLKIENGVYQNLVHMQSYGAADNLHGEFQHNSYASKEHKKPMHRLTSAKSVKSKQTIVDIESAQDDGALPVVSFWRILAFNKSEKWFILLGCLAAAVNGGIQPIFAILFSEILAVFSETNESTKQARITLYALLFVAVGAATFLAYLAQLSAFAKSGEELTLRLRLMSFRAVLHQEIGYFDDPANNTGALTTRLATDASKVQGATGIRLATIMQSFAALGVGLGIAFAYGWQVALLALAFVPFIAAAGILQGQLLVGQASTETKAYEKAGQVAVEGTLNIRTIASLTLEKAFHQRYVNALEIPYKKSLRKAYAFGITYGFSQCVAFFAYAACFRFGAWLVEQELIAFQNIFKVLLAVVFGALAAGQTSAYAPDYAQAKTSAARIVKLLDRVPLIDSYSKRGDVPAISSGNVLFKDVQFTYPSRPDIQVLKGLTQIVCPGQTVALVGQSGCGKSTCIQLLERFYDPSDGSVSVDGHLSNELQLSWLRSQFGIVSQEPVLFDRSIADNIRYGDNSRSADLKEVIAAAKNANIHSFIEGLPDGYDTNVGSKGAQLSGGQKQRVAIARALLRNPKVLLLDEATSALDTESEKIVQAALDAASEGRTCIVIAHRLSTVKNADVIAVIENGSVVERGTHNELLALKGSYFSLVNAQLHKKEA
ncbi:ATP-dependent translocase ABCB1-like [Clavelina lepadiformis]|uniref:ATP-dependent translocase ABCB1-like n=1 Tax=Clavelina lepadiformis TaxID=159417 RepID=UPI004041F93F